jgi:hypothetical protein
MINTELYRPLARNRKLKNERAGKEKKRANQASHRYNRLPLLPSDPGGVQQELVVLACHCKDTIEIRFITRSPVKKSDRRLFRSPSDNFHRCLRILF